MEASTGMIRHGEASKPVPHRPTTGGANAEPAQLFQLVMLRALLLPPRCRDVFVLKEIHGYTPAEIAAALGISTTDVNRHLRKAMREVGEK
jgi:RNA polymerase sigma factor (sigma-70 family)